MIRRTIPDRKRLRSLARETAAGLSDVGGAGQGTRFLLGLAVEGVGAIIETAFVLGGRGRRWYQDGLGQHFADPIDALVRLAEQEADPQQREQVDKVLCRAFLADLRDEYSSRLLQLYRRQENCLAVLDDAFGRRPRIPRRARGTAAGLGSAAHRLRLGDPLTHHRPPAS